MHNYQFNLELLYFTCFAELIDTTAFDFSVLWHLFSSYKNMHVITSDE